MGEGGGEADSAVLLLPPPRGAEEEPQLTFLRGEQTSDHMGFVQVTEVRGQGRRPPDHMVIALDYSHYYERCSIKSGHHKRDDKS